MKSSSYLYRKRALALFTAGASLPELAREYGCACATVRGAMIRAAGGIEGYRKAKAAHDDTRITLGVKPDPARGRAALAAFKAGASLPTLADEYGTTCSAIRGTILRAAGGLAGYTKAKALHDAKLVRRTPVRAKLRTFLHRRTTPR